MDPRIVGDLTRVAGYRTPQGKVSSEWTLEAGTFRLDVTVPPNTRAEIRVPTAGGKVHARPHGATFVRMDGDRAIYRVGSGSYAFTTRGFDPAA